MSDLPQTNKSLGQHWLTDKSALEGICDLAEISSKDVVLEVGPGPGTLTKYLSERAEKVIAVEFDQKLAQDLTKKYTDTNVEVRHEDILKFDLTSVTQPYKVVANIPYYLTSNLVRVLCESSSPPVSMTLLVQKEVAERIAAGPGKMSLLSVSVQFYCEVTSGEPVPAYLFTPPPKVDSQVIKMVYRTKPLFDGVDTSTFFRIVKAGFSERRKKLRSSLAGGMQMEKSAVEAWLAAARISPDQRAQELTLQQWHALYNSLAALK